MLRNALAGSSRSILAPGVSSNAFVTLEGRLLSVYPFQRSATTLAAGFPRVTHRVRLNITSGRRRTDSDDHL